MLISFGDKNLHLKCSMLTLSENSVIVSPTSTRLAQGSGANDCTVKSLALKRIIMKIVIHIPEYNNHEHNRVRRQQKFYSLPKRYKQIRLNTNSRQRVFARNIKSVCIA